MKGEMGMVTMEDDPGHQPHDEGRKHHLKIISVFVALLLIVTAIAIVLYSLPSAAPDADTITLYGFSVKGELFDETVIPRFQEYWRNKTGESIDFKTTYAGSGKITNQVINGAPAEVMILSTEWDAIQLRNNGLVSTDWSTFPYNGTVSKSPWVIMTRAGNPEGITDFPDLTAQGIELVHADPLTSGGACWSIFATYGSALKKSALAEGEENATEARELVDGIVENVISWQSSARNVLAQFDLGYGDAIITYENEALLATSLGKDYCIVYPQSTIYSEHKVVMVDENIDEKEKEVIEEFVAFLFREDIQEQVVEYGFRSVMDEINSGHEELPPIEMPFTVDYLGGWETAHLELIDGLYADLREG